jgi:hypothetical protein
METTNTTIGARPALALARGRRTVTLLSLFLGISVLANIVSPLYFWYQSGQKQNLVVFDLASGSLLLSPVVDPGDSKEILEISSSWGARVVLERDAMGLDHEDLMSVLFNSETARKVRDEYAAVHAEYTAKKLESHIRISSIDAQPVGKGLIRSTVGCECVTTGIVNGEPWREIKMLTLQLSLARNPDLGKNHRYPLVVVAYQYVDGAPAAVAEK